MFKGVAFALSACFCWGLIYVVPLFTKDFTAIELSMGRYLFYGLISTLILLKTNLQGLGHYPTSIWLKSLFFSLMATVGFYPFIVLGMRYATPAIAALIIGIGPVSIAFYGNWLEKECSFKSLVLPSILILCGLTLVNAPHIQMTDAPLGYLFGVVCSFISLTTWTWYVVANSRFLKNHPEIDSNNWSTLIGVSTLFWVGLFVLFFGFFFPELLSFKKLLTPSSELTSFVIGSLVLGGICSWLAASLWNRASLYLPVSLAGQLTIFETIFGVLFVYSVEMQMPPLFECLGMGLFLVAIYYGIRSFNESPVIGTA